MKKNSIISFIGTYFLIVFLVIGLNILLYLPVNNIIKNSNEIQSKYETQITNLGSESTVAKYIEEMQEGYGNYFRVFTNMIIALYVVISLSLVVVGLSLRVNSNRNKGIYNAIIAAGITTILYLIWFVLFVPGTIGMLF